MKVDKEMEEVVSDNFIEASIEALQHKCYNNSVKAGWHTDIKTGKPLNLIQQDELFPTRIELCHSELSEALEGYRKGLKDDHLTNREMAEVELADTCIRIFDLAGAMGYDLAGAIIEKLDYNKKRADHKIENRTKEGGKKF